jgi:hypothetical protein
MFGVMKVLGGVLVLGGITASHVSALQAQPQVDPGIAHFDALFTNVFVCRFNSNLIEM